MLRRTFPARLSPASILTVVILSFLFQIGQSNENSQEVTCSTTCVAQNCNTIGIRYGKYCGVGWSGCPGEKPCDDLDACCKVHDDCVGQKGMNNVKCHQKFKRCIKKVQKSGKPGFSTVCPVDVAVPTMDQDFSQDRWYCDRKALQSSKKLMESDENGTPLPPSSGTTFSAGDKGSSRKSIELNTCESNVVKRPVRLTALDIFLEKRMGRLHNAVDQNVQKRNPLRDVASNPIRKQNVNGRNGTRNPVTCDSSERNPLRDIAGNPIREQIVNERNGMNDPVTHHSSGGNTSILYTTASSTIITQVVVVNSSSVAAMQQLLPYFKITTNVFPSPFYGLKNLCHTKKLQWEIKGERN